MRIVVENNDNVMEPAAQETGGDKRVAAVVAGTGDNQYASAARSDPARDFRRSESGTFHQTGWLQAGERFAFELAYAGGAIHGNECV